MSARYDNLIAAGLCADCGKVPPRPNLRQCEGCSEARKTSKRRAYLRRVCPAYIEKFPLDTPGRTFEAIAGRIRAGEAESDVLRDYGLCHVEEIERLKQLNGELVEQRNTALASFAAARGREDEAKQAMSAMSAVVSAAVALQMADHAYEHTGTKDRGEELDDLNILLGASHEARIALSEAVTGWRGGTKEDGN